MNLPSPQCGRLYTVHNYSTKLHTWEDALTAPIHWQGEAAHTCMFTCKILIEILGWMAGREGT